MRVSFALLLALFALPTRGLAQASGDDEPAGYRAAIRAAVAEYEAASYVEAREQFRRAHELFPNARTLRGLGLTEFELHHYPESKRYLEQALASGVKPLDAAMRADTEAVLARARGYVGLVQLRLEPKTSSVRIDGEPLDSASREPLSLSVGDHIFEFSAPGRLGQRRSLNVRGGQTHMLRVQLAETNLSESSPVTAGGTLPSEREPARAPVYKKWWLWTIVGAAVAGAVTGTLYATRSEVTHERPYGTANTPPNGALSTRE